MGTIALKITDPINCQGFGDKSNLFVVLKKFDWWRETSTLNIEFAVFENGQKAVKGEREDEIELVESAKKYQTVEVNVPIDELPDTVKDFLYGQLEASLIEKKINYQQING